MLAREAIGKTPFEKAVSRGMTRHGVMVSTQSLYKAARQSPRAKLAVERAIRHIESEMAQRNKAKDSLGLAISERKKFILLGLRASGYRKIHASEFMAGLIAATGLERERLLPYVKAAKILMAGGRLPVEKASWVVSYASMARKDMFSRIDKILSGTQTPLTTTEIGEKLGIGFSALSQKEKEMRLSEIGNSLAVLDLLGLAVKMPHALRGKENRPQYLWVAPESRKGPATIPRDNPRFKLLQALREGPMTMSQLAGRLGVLEKGSGFSRYPTWVKSGLLFLENSGAIQREHAALGGILGGTFKLTDIGKEITGEQTRTEHITPRMRLLLLGEHQGRPVDIRQSQLERFRLYAEAVVGYQETGNAKSVAEKLKMDKQSVLNLAKGTTRPFRHYKIITSYYIPWLKQQDKALAEKFERWLAENRGLFGK